MSSLALLALVQSGDAAPRSAQPALGKQAELAQFMTPEPIATFMAAQFDDMDLPTIRLLDAGAGRGALSTAFAHRWTSLARPQSRLVMDAFEIDADMVGLLSQAAARWEADKRVDANVFAGDFIGRAVERMRRRDASYTHAIINPPYKKIATHSEARLALGGVGIETVNLYSGFVALALQMLGRHGQIVAIIPRSFCNGPYYRTFRNLILDSASIESIHLFLARDKAFAADGVLQENVIIRLRKGGQQGGVLITTSTDGTFHDLVRRSISFDRIVTPGDKERFIRIPVRKDGDVLRSLAAYRTTLSELDVTVSTGPVVDFRMKRHLRMMPAAGDVPLLYPGHFAGEGLEWPRASFKKPNALALNADTARWLYPPGFYVVVRRFSTKEEKRRIVANVVRPEALPDGPYGFENHLNVFRRKRGPLPEDVARGLTVYLNAKVVDDWFRQFNGHTQVNATDLRALPYPDTQRLLQLGSWGKSHPSATPAEVDAKVSQLR